MDSDSIFYGELSTLKRQRSIYNDNENVTSLDYSDAVTEELDVQRNIGKSAKFLIYKCVSSCGGLGDRLRGIVNSYVMARITGRTFGIIHKVPCELSKFLKPNKYDWRIDPKHFRNKSSKVYSVMDSFKLPSKNMTSYFKEDVVYFKTNTDITKHLRMQLDVPERTPWLTRLTTADIYRSVLLHLFTLNDHLRRKMSEFNSKFVQGNRTVCAHFRAGKNPTIPNDVPRNVGSRDKLWKFLSRFDKPGNVIYVASDSTDVKAEAKAKFPKRLINIEGKIVHTDRGKDDRDCHGFQLTVLEHALLTSCDVLFLTISGYGRTAGFMRGHSRNMYCLQNTGILQCSRHTLHEVLPGSYSPQAWK
ncbi:hypothetical protein FSP39_009727 [Pinctada imbricata]|uniref:Uncharacterized protein n=1 Tax=Pinctada imbricata TaxID=66713 RepID=A0AA88YE82_PINIB|nr:hypothetical protein FSP39_009727 [Pinctada imbricata]